MQRPFGVSMTPMIDVVFLLLIFFVCTASFQTAESTLPSPLSLDGATAANLAEPQLNEIELERVLIGVAERDNALLLTINGQHCPSLARLSELLSALSNIDATLPVLLDIAGDTPLGTAIDIYDRCRLASFQNIQFAAEATP